MKYCVCICKLVYIEEESKGDDGPTNLAIKRQKTPLQIFEVVDSMEEVGAREKPFIKDPSPMELKEMSDNLIYAFMNT